MVSHNKRIVAILAAVAAMGMGLAGCGSGTAGDAKASGDGGVVNITYMHRLPDSAGMTLVNDIVARWNKEHPNIQVKATKFDGNASYMIKKLETDTKAGVAPDLAQVSYAELPEIYSKDMVQDVSKEAAKYEDTFVPGPFSLMQVAGKTYGLPQDTGPLTYFYNKAEFDKLGLTVPKTADELIESAKKAAAQGKYIMSFQPDAAGTLVSLAGGAGPWYKVNGNSWNVDAWTKGSQAVAGVYQQLIDAKATATVPRWNPSFDELLQNGTLIGTVAAAWEAPLFIESSGGTGAGDWRITQLGDWFGAKDEIGPGQGSGVAVLKGSKHPAEAMEFLAWFNTQSEDLTSQGLVSPASGKIANTPQKWADFFGGEDLMKEFAKANERMSTDFAYIPGFSAVDNAMQEQASKAADGSAKVSDIFDAAQKTSVETLKNLGLSVKE